MCKVGIGGYVMKIKTISVIIIVAIVFTILGGFTASANIFVEDGVTYVNGFKITKPFNVTSEEIEWNYYS